MLSGAFAGVQVLAHLLFKQPAWLPQGYLNRSGAHCESWQWQQGLSCWQGELFLAHDENVLDRLVSCCSGQTPEICWAEGRSAVECCAPFLPQILGRMLYNRTATVVSTTLRLSFAEVKTAMRLLWACFEHLPKVLQEPVRNSVYTMRAMWAVHTHSAVPLEFGRKDPLKLSANSRLSFQQRKIRLVKDYSVRHECVLNIFTGSCQALHVPIFPRLGMVQGPSNRDESLDFLGVTTGSEIVCPKHSFSSADCPSRVFTCHALRRNWQRLRPLLDEEVQRVGRCAGDRLVRCRAGRALCHGGRGRRGIRAVGGARRQSLPAQGARLAEL
ncbi:unnamed protein product [Effrenium voratum]|uniref:Uncharacterized protein n=1 Tax=Effrenium voratum TaxID=2562239 RepID=A0AA36NF23_9DINO|nr:unnamed protein product [Effrenium voratum]